MKRLFLALWPDQDTRRALDHEAHRVIRKRARPVPAINLHVTLAFLGNVDEPSQACVSAACARVAVEPFELVIDSVGHWPRPRILWLAPSQRPEPLMALARTLTTGMRGCGLSLDPRPYRPHVTIARKVGRWPHDDRVRPVNWAVDRFALVESVTAPEGARYQVLETWTG